MKKSVKSFVPPTAVIPYSVLVGKVIEKARVQSGISQTDVATALGITQPAYSRLENGKATISLTQLRIISQRLGLESSEILSEADNLAAKVVENGGEITNEKQYDAGALLVGLGLLVALLALK